MIHIFWEAKSHSGEKYLGGMRWAGRESGIVCPAIFSWKFDQSINGQERETFEENAFERWGMESMDGGAIGEEEKWAKV